MNSPLIVHDRRSDLELREAFDAVYDRVGAFFDPSRNWGGTPMLHGVHRVVRESCPHLSATQVQVLVAALHRAHVAQRARVATSNAGAPLAIELAGSPA